MGSFCFKQFSVRNDLSAMKVGTDGVLLGAWSTTKPGRILDVGTGTGVIALMMAQRESSSEIVAVDIDSPSIEEASVNFAQSPWSDRLSAVRCDFRTMDGSFDMIVSNPPYFVDSLKSANARRNDARHTDSLSQDELISGVVRMLAPAGLFAAVLPYDEGRQFVMKAESAGLKLSRRCAVSTKEGKAPSRLLLEFSLVCDNAPVEEKLSIHGSDGGWSEGYISLTRDFYLYF